MPKPKTRKSILKRFKFTKSGKILMRAAGQDHFRAKKSSGKIRAKRRWLEVPKPVARQLKRYLRYIGQPG